MGGKPEAERPTKPSKKKKMTAEEQHALLVKTARDLGGDEVGEGFERAFDFIARPKQPASPRQDISSPPTSTDSTSPDKEH